MNIVDALINIVVSTIVLSPVLWFTGRSLVGKEKAKFFDAIWIVLLGTVLGAVVGFFLPALVAAIVMFIVWLALIKHFFDCGWGKALLIAIIAVIIYIIIGVLIGLIVGVAVFTLGF